MEKKYSLFFAKIICGYSLIDMMYGATYILLMTSIGISESKISLLLSFSSLFLFIFDLPSGNFADIHGRKKATSLGLIIWGIGLIGFGLSKIYWMLFIFSVVCALGVALFSGSPQAWYIDKLKEINKYEYKNKVFPLLGGILSVFSAIGALLASFLNSYYSNMMISIIICGILSIALGIYTFLFFEDNFGITKNNNFLKEMFFSLKEFINDKSMKKLLIFNILNGVPFTLFLLTWQIYSINYLKTDSSLIGIMMVVFMLVQAFSGFLSAKLIEKTTNINLTIVGVLIVIISFIIFILLGQINIVYLAGLILIEFGLGLVFNNVGSWSQDLIPSEKRSTYSSTITSVNSIFNFFTGLCLSLILSFFEIKIAWILACVIEFMCFWYLIIKIRPICSKLSNGD